MDLATTVYDPPRAKTSWRVDDLFAPAELRFYGHGRNALFEALQLIDVKGGRVLLPSFVCRDLLAAVAAAGAEPVFYPVAPNLEPAIDPSDWPDARAALAVDFFGWPQALSPFDSYSRRSGAVIIEDAAHALFSRDSSGHLLGSRAPLGILSLRKSLPLPNGGALIVSDPKFASRLPPQRPAASVLGRRSALKTAARPFLAMAGARAALRALTAIRGLRGDPSGHVSAEENTEVSLPSPASPCRQLAKPLTCADPAIESSRRRALWSHCDNLARASGLSPVFDSLPDEVVPYAYAFRTANLAAARGVFAGAGLTTLPWPDLPAAVASSASDADKTVALVHFLW